MPAYATIPIRPLPGRRKNHVEGWDQAVKPARFAYYDPSTVSEVVSLLAEHGDDAKVLAGGQSLVPVLRLRLAAPSVLVDLGGIASLRGVREEGDELVLGAMTRHADVLHDPLVARYAPLLAQATALVADRQTRYLGTVGGSLSHADPAADLPAVVTTAASPRPGWR